jgi:hypothetical protein
MTTLELPLDEDLHAFVIRQSQARGHASAAAYVESLLAMERMRERPEHVAALLQEALDDPDEPQVVDDGYWKRLEAEVFGKRQPGNVP